MGSIGRYLFFAGGFAVLLWWTVPALKAALAKAKAERAKLSEESAEYIAGIDAEEDDDLPIG